MKAYREVWDEKNNQYTYISFDVKHKFDFESAPETNLYNTENGYNLEEDYILSMVMQDNERLRTGEYKVYKCKDCGKFFTLTIDERAWFEERGLNIPKRCPRCRDKRKAGK